MHILHGPVHLALALAADTIGLPPSPLVIDELVELFHKLEGLKIQYKLRDLNSDVRFAQGVEAIITIEAR